MTSPFEDENEDENEDDDEEMRQGILSLLE